MESLKEIKIEKEFVPDFMYIQRLEEYCEVLKSRHDQLKIDSIPKEFGTGELLIKIDELTNDLEEAKEGEEYWKRRFDDIKHENARLNDKIEFIKINQMLDSKKNIDEERE